MSRSGEGGLRWIGPIAPYVLSVAIGSTAYIAQFAAATVAAREITGSGQLAGLPSAFGTLGTAFGVALLTAIMHRGGRRRGLVVGFVGATIGSALGVLAVALGSFPVLVMGGFAVGFGNGALQLTRYAAADLVDLRRRAAAVSVIVWGSTVGAVLGPNLVDPAGRVASALGRPALEGGLALAAIGFAATLLLALVGPSRPPTSEPDPSLDPSDPGLLDATAPSAPARPTLGATLAEPRVRIALLALLSGQAVMNLLMTMAPVHIHDMGEPLSSVGFVISAHTLGMFALAPLTARLVARFGPVRVVLAGFVVLALSAVVSGAAREADLPLLALGLFLLGYGWNLAFVAGSTLLTLGSGWDQRVRLQGIADALVWTLSALAAGLSGPILAAVGYAGLAATGGAFLVLPALAVLALRRGRSAIEAVAA